MRQVQFLFFLFMLTGCQALGISSTHRAPHSVYEALWAANTAGKGATITVNQLRVDRLITDNQKTDALDMLQQARDNVTQGLTLYESGDYKGAQTNLDKVESILRVINILISNAEEARK